MSSESCQYCGVDLEARPPGEEESWLYGVECSRCPLARRRSLVLIRPTRAASLICPDCGAVIAPAEAHPDVLVVKQVFHDVCPGCGERCGVASVRKLVDRADGAM